MKTLIAGWIAVTVALALIAANDGGVLAHWVALAPPKIWHGELWRLVTWPFVETSIFDGLLKAIIIYRFAAVLVTTWSARKLVVYVVAIAALAAIATCAVALVSHTVADLQRCGGWMLTEVLIIAVVRSFPDYQLVVFNGPIRMSGARGLIIVVAFTGLLVGVAGPLAMVPELVACAAAIVFPI